MSELYMVGYYPEPIGSEVDALAQPSFDYPGNTPMNIDQAKECLLFINGTRDKGYRIFAVTVVEAHVEQVHR